ncbi:MAG TPA: hypothetical protein VL527_08170 [Dongiaceae bacterium]|nr:hypothetical protein [Dongiaceae bacterium]
MESTFTLPPEALAWGWQLLPADPKSPAGPAQPEALVAVVRKEVLADYKAVFTAAGLNPVFTPAALVRHVPGPAPAGPYAILEVGRASSELACFTAGVVESVRVIPWGMTKGDAIPGAAELDLGTDSPRRKLFFSCDPAQRAAVAARLREHGGPDWEPLPVPPGSSAAIVGLSQSNIAMGGMLRLEPQTRSAASRFDFSGAETKMWLRRAAVLLALLLVLPYVEAVLLRPLIAKQFSRTRVKKDQLVGVVDRELHFLQYLKQNQPPYLDALYLLAKAAPPDTSLNPISLNRKGEIALQATFQNAQQVMDFRARLNDNGSFTNVVVEEQVPTPDRQHVTARLTARWNLAAIANRPKALTEAPETQTSPTSRAVPPAGAAMPATPAKP